MDRPMIVAVKRKLKPIFLENLRHNAKIRATKKEGNILLPIVPDDLSLLASGVVPAQAGSMTEVPKA